MKRLSLSILFVLSTILLSYCQDTIKNKIQNLSLHNLTLKQTDSLRKIDGAFLSAALNKNFSLFDVKVNFRILKFFYLGLSANESRTRNLGLSGVYPNAEIKLPMSFRKKAYVWGNAGYEYTFLQNNFKGPSYRSYLYEIGADYFFSSKLGIRLYSLEVRNLYFGLVFR